jgi:protein KTI12
VTVHCDVNPEEAWEWNSARTDGLAYDRAVFDGLLARYEEPCAANRWDSPLVSALSPRSGVALPLEDVYAALFGRKPPPPNQSTQSAPLMPTNFLHELDRVAKDIVAAVLEAQKAGAVEGDDLTVPGTGEKFHLCRKLSMAELSRAKRQFIAYAKTRPVEDINKLATMFVQHLNTSADTT